MTGVNPQGVQVVGIRSPSPEELDHDFLWRISKALPERGRIGIFNRSDYEEVRSPSRTDPEWLGRQKLPRAPRGPALWEERYEDINNFERHLDRTRTKIVKFFLHVSKREQKERFLARLDTPGREWKFNAADVDERARWDDHMAALETARTATSTPWHRGTSSPLTTSGSLRRSLSRSSSTRSRPSTSAGPRSPSRSTYPTWRLERSSNLSPTRHPTRLRPALAAIPRLLPIPLTLSSGTREITGYALVASAYLSPSRAHARQVRVGGTHPAAVIMTVGPGRVGHWSRFYRGAPRRRFELSWRRLAPR